MTEKETIDAIVKWLARQEDAALRLARMRAVAGSSKESDDFTSRANAYRNVRESIARRAHVLIHPDDLEVTP